MVGWWCEGYALRGIGCIHCVDLHSSVCVYTHTPTHPPTKGAQQQQHVCMRVCVQVSLCVCVCVGVFLTSAKERREGRWRQSILEMVESALPRLAAAIPGGVWVGGWWFDGCGLFQGGGEGGLVWFDGGGLFYFIVCVWGGGGLVGSHSLTPFPPLSLTDEDAHRGGVVPLRHVVIEVRDGQRLEVTLWWRGGAYIHIYCLGCCWVGAAAVPVSCIHSFIHSIMHSSTHSFIHPPPVSSPHSSLHPLTCSPRAMRRPPWACEGLRGRLYTIQVRGTEPPSTGGGRLLFFQKGWVGCVCKRVDWGGGGGNGCVCV